MRILVTGGAGYIGSHTLVEILNAGHRVMALDNFSNSYPNAIRQVEKVTGKITNFVKGDIRDEKLMAEMVSTFRPDVVLHLAGLKAVNESLAQPLKYYENNVQGSLSLLKAMGDCGCDRIVYSSSATIYGEARYLPYDERHPVQPNTPYGRSKAMVEDLIADWCAASCSRAAALLRYFNPGGAHASGLMGEDPQGVANNLLPRIAQAAVGKGAFVQIFGQDYPTRDGTGLRDYLHITDLAHAHMAAIAYIKDYRSCEAINLGSGSGTTVLELLRAFEAAAARRIPHRVAPRRPGDIAVSLAGIGKARHLLGWKPRYSIGDICRSTWNWQTKYPAGYASISP